MGKLAIGSSSGQRVRLVCGLIAFALVQGLISIAGRGLIDEDDARVAGIAREMALSGDYAVPYLNGERFLEYPSLGYIPIALVLSLSDHPDSFLVLLPAVLLGLGTIFFTYRIGLVLGGERIGLRSGFMLATTAGFYSLHRRGLVDPSLLFWITVSLYGFIASLKARNGPNGSHSRNIRELKASSAATRRLSKAREDATSDLEHQTRKRGENRRGAQE